jgi:hypothetical protein
MGRYSSADSEQRHKHLSAVRLPLACCGVLRAELALQVLQCCHAFNLLLGQPKPPATIDLPKAVVLDRSQAVIGSDPLGTVQCSRERTRKDHVDALVLEKICCRLHKSNPLIGWLA